MRMSRLQRAVVPLAAALAIAWTSGAASAEKKGGTVNLTQALKRSLLLFPVDVAQTSVTNASDLSMVLTDVAASRLSASGQYTVSRFNRNLPTVARLHMDQQLTDADVQPPFAEDNRKAVKVGKLAGYEVVFIGSVDDYQYSQADNQVSVVVSGRLVETETGKIVKSVVTSAASDKGGTAKEDERSVEAVRAAGEKLMTQLLPGAPTVVEPTTPTTTKPEKTAPAAKKRRGNLDWLWGVLAVGLGLGIGLSTSGGHGGSSSGGGGESPPPPPS